MPGNNVELKFGGDVSGVEKALQSMVGELDKTEGKTANFWNRFNQGIQKADGRLGKLKRGVAALAGAMGVKNLFGSSSERAEEIRYAAGISEQDPMLIQKFAAAGRTDYEAGGELLRALSEAIEEARIDPKSARAVGFNMLGIGTKELAGKNTEDVFRLMGDRISQFKPSTERFELALQELGLGTEGAIFKQLLRGDTGAALDRGLEGAMTPEEIATFTRSRDNFRRLKRNVGGVADTIFAGALDLPSGIAEGAQLLPARMAADAARARATMDAGAAISTEMVKEIRIQSAYLRDLSEAFKRSPAIRIPD